MMMIMWVIMIMIMKMIVMIEVNQILQLEKIYLQHLKLAINSQHQLYN